MPQRWEKVFVSCQLLRVVPVMQRLRTKCVADGGKNAAALVAADAEGNRQATTASCSARFPLLLTQPPSEKVKTTLMPLLQAWSICCGGLRSGKSSKRSAVILIGSSLAQRLLARVACSLLLALILRDLMSPAHHRGEANLLKKGEHLGIIRVTSFLISVE